MLDQHDQRTITANVDEILEALQSNLEEHKEILTEARQGYIEDARKAILKAQDQITGMTTRLDEGEVFPLHSISLGLNPPKDHSKDFLTAIRMLELHRNSHVPTDEKPQATIELKAIDVRRFVQNDWDWTDRFLQNVSAYSGKAQMLASEKGLL